MTYLKKLVLTAVFLVSSSFVYADVHNIDLSHSKVGFSIRHLIAKTSGHFGQFSGTIDFDDKDWSKTKIDATIQTASINTNDEKRDAHLKNADFFNVEKFPTMTFKSTSAKKVSDNKFTVTGDLTLLGVTKPVTLEVDYAGTMNDPWGGTRSGFSAKGKLNRKDFGMVYNVALDKGGFVIGDDVEITIEIEGIKKK